VEPANARFGGGAASTMLHPLVAVALLIAIVLMLLLPRKHVIAPFLLAVFLVPMGQGLVVGGMHFLVIRILILVGCARFISSMLSPRTGAFAEGFKSIDQAVTLWAFFYALSFTLIWMEWQALINRLGFLVDILGGYFLLRFLIQDMDDVRRAIKVFALIAVVNAICMMNEQLTGQNIFGRLGGIASASVVRDGRVRSQGAFQVYILAGVFGATFLPLFAWLWKDRVSRILGLVGMTSATIMVVTSASSTPDLALVAGIVGLCFWPLRKEMRLIRWGLVFMLVALHLVMKAPVWALIARVDLTGASSGEHRFRLVDNFIRHFGDWWLLGAKNYNDWGWEMWDLSNQYVASGLQGGLATLICFIAIISRGFGRLGKARARVAGDRKQEWFLWFLGASMFAHVVAYFGISYFDQMEFAWFAFLAIIYVATIKAIRPEVEQVEVVGDFHAASVPSQVGVGLSDQPNKFG
jgi:hypothetical protein